MGSSVVPFLDLEALHRPIRAELLRATERVLDRGRFVLGSEVSSFEDRWAQTSDSDFCIGVGNGLDALVLSLEALGIGMGDHVLVPSNTYIATWLAISAVGAIPVPVEPDPLTHVITPEGAEAHIDGRTRALLPVHLYGRAVDIDGFETLAAQRGLVLLFDAAQAHGSKYKGQSVGGGGHATAWSFYPTKNLGALGDGGAVTTNDPMVAERIRLLRNYGSDHRNSFLIRGHNSRLDELQAAFLNVKLDSLEAWAARRQEIASWYLQELSGLEIDLPYDEFHESNGWHLFVVRSRDRDQLRRELAESGIETDIHYPVPPHRQPAYVDLSKDFGPLPVADVLSSEVMSLPLNPALEDRQVERVLSKLQVAAR